MATALERVQMVVADKLGVEPAETPFEGGPGGDNSAWAPAPPPGLGAGGADPCGGVFGGLDRRRLGATFRRAGGQ